MPCSTAEGITMEKYCVFDIQNFSYHDGPGIRTTVFLKGCGMRCFWCQNPESQSEYPELMYFEQLCIHCGQCKMICGREAVRNIKGLRIERSLCNGCGTCAQICPTGALKIAGTYMTGQEILERVNKDREFFGHEGGMTLSGGEPLLDAKADSLLKMAKEVGIGTVVQTAGHITREVLERAARYTDLFLYDIKTYDDAKHKKVCGCGNTDILQNLEWLVKNAARVQVRIPVIPGVNDDEKQIDDIARYVSRLGLNAPELLTFHKLGISKYTALGRRYEAMILQETGHKRLAILRQVVDSCFKEREEGNDF